MKRQSYTLRASIVGMLVLLAVGMAHAQIGGDVLKVKVPFNFSVGTQTFPAGEYGLRPLLPNVLLLRNQAGQILTSIATNSVGSTEARSTTKLVFNRYAGQYFLAQIWQGDGIGREVIKSPVEVEMATKYSSGPQIALLVSTHH